jgi:HK97 gp10 family phage protein
MKIQGADRLKRKLRVLPKIAREEIRKALAQGAEEIADLARRLVPVDEGDLRASIGWTFGRPPKGSRILGQAKGNGIAATIYAGSSEAFYSRWVEFGTVKMRARPYFYPAYRLGRKRAKSRISRAMTKAAKRVAASK